MPNQYTTDPYAQQRPSTFDYLSGQGGGAPMQRTVGQSVNQALPNLDPGKMSAGWAPGSSDIVSMLAQRGYRQPGQDAPQSSSTGTAGVAPGTSQTYEEFYGAAGAPAARETAQFSDYGETLAGRAKGKRTATDVAEEGLALKQMREQQEAQAVRQIGASGFASSSALNLDYNNYVQRQVGELMVRRRAQQEEQARTQYMEWLAQGEQRRKAREDEDIRRQNMAEQQRQFDQQQAQAKKNRRGGLLGKVGGAAGGVLGGMYGGPAGAAAGGAAGSALIDWLAGS